MVPSSSKNHNWHHRRSFHLWHDGPRAVTAEILFVVDDLLYARPMSRGKPCSIAFLLALGALSIGACKRSAPEATKEPPPAVSSVPQAIASSLAQAPAASSSSAPVAPPKPSSSGPTELSAAEKALASAYLAALGRGRRLTRAKTWQEAIQSFDEALRLRPHDGTALAERGYAKLLAKDYEGARVDLNEAQDRAGAPEIIAQVWYNLGILEKETGNEVIGDDWIERAKVLRAHVRSDKSASANTRCPLQIDRPKTQGIVIAGWNALRKALDDDYQKRFSEPLTWKSSSNASAEEIRQELTHATEDGKRVWLLQVSGESGNMTWHVVGALPDGKLVLFAGIANSYQGRCSMGTQSAGLSMEGVPHVMLEEVESVYGMLCELKNGEYAACKGEEGENPVQSFCGYGTVTLSALFFDIEAKKQTLSISQTKPDKDGGPHAWDVSLVVQNDGVLLTGAGCGGKESFTK